MICHISSIKLLTLVISILSAIQYTTSANEVEFPLVHPAAYKNSDTESWEKTEDVYNFVTQEGTDFTVVDPNVARIVIACRAPYPIYWEMIDVQTRSLNKLFTHSKAFYGENGTEFMFQEFHTYLDLSNTPSLTGEYKCRSVSDEDKAKSIYFFLRGTKDDSRSFSFPAGIMTVGLNGAKGSLILPCKVTRKDLPVYLYLFEDEKWVPTGLTYKFEVKKGFVVDIIAGQEALVGKRYKCTVEISVEDDLIMDVVEEYYVNSSFPYLSLMEGTAAWKEKKSKVGVQCCSNSKAPPKMLGVLCENKPHCDMVKKIFMQLPTPIETRQTLGLIPTAKSKQCVETATFGPLMRPFLLQCFGDGLNFSAEIVNEFRLPANTQMNYVATIPSENYTNPPNNTIRILALKRVGEDEKVVRVDLQREPIYEGDKLVLDCCGLLYHHAIGRIQRIGWENGTFKRVPTPETFQSSSEVPYFEDFCFRYVYNPEDMEQYFLTMDVGMRYFECMVPLWNDVQPVIQRVELHIRAITPPVLTSNETAVNLTYDENQVGILSLNCGLQKGDPLPKMRWTKDGNKVNQTDKRWSWVKDNNLKNIQVHGTNLLFMRASLAIHGEYVCIAENKKGKVQKSFFVEVKPRSYTDYWIALGVFGSFFLMIIFCALRVTTLDKPSFAKRVEPEKVLE